MPCINRYPIYGQARPGTGQYVYGGFAYGGYRGWGQANTVSASVVTRPLPTSAGEELATAFRQQALTLRAQAQSLAIIGDTRRANALHAASQALEMRAEQARLGGAGAHEVAAAGEHPGRGRGVPERVKEWWAARTPGQKAATVGGGAAAALLLL